MVNAVSSLLACSVCFGDPDSAGSKAVLAGVAFLFGVILFVLAGIAWTAFSWHRRSKQLQNISS